MGWRNLEIDHLIIGELITRPATRGDDQHIASPPGPTDTESPLTRISAGIRGIMRNRSDRETAPRRGGEGTGGNRDDSRRATATELRADRN
jgi:hypothetical protein